MAEMAETAEMEWEVSRKSVQEKIMIVIESLHSTPLEVFIILYRLITALVIDNEFIEH